MARTLLLPEEVLFVCLTVFSLDVDVLKLLLLKPFRLHFELRRDVGVVHQLAQPNYQVDYREPLEAHKNHSRVVDLLDVSTLLEPSSRLRQLRSVSASIRVGVLQSALRVLIAVPLRSPQQHSTGPLGFC